VLKYELTRAIGIMIVVFRRIPAILLAYKFMPDCVIDWKEALFMGYFGPIGIGAVSLSHSPTFCSRHGLYIDRYKAKSY
jgi:NhaP-type Na+/H+ or K+/H+ antiporter